MPNSGAHNLISIWEVPHDDYNNRVENRNFSGIPMAPSFKCQVEAEELTDEGADTEVHV